MEFKAGDRVIYNSRQTHIEFINNNKTCIIANPDWDWDDEAICVNNGEIYCVPYWLTVSFSELKKAKS